MCTVKSHLSTQPLLSWIPKCHRCCHTPWQVSVLDRILKGGKIGVEGSNLNGSSNRSHFCRIYTVSVNASLGPLPSHWKRPVQVRALKLKLHYCLSKSAFANAY